MAPYNTAKGFAVEGLKLGKSMKFAKTAKCMQWGKISPYTSEVYFWRKNSNIFKMYEKRLQRKSRVTPKITSTTEIPRTRVTHILLQKWRPKQFGKLILNYKTRLVKYLTPVQREGLVHEAIVAQNVSDYYWMRRSQRKHGLEFYSFKESLTACCH